MSDAVEVGIRRLAALALAAMAVLAAATFYWGFARADELAARPDNPRRRLFDERILRGRILDRRGDVLAETRFGGDGPERVYPLPAAAPVTGFQTWRYGVGAAGSRTSYGAGGVEAAYDVALRGDLGLSARELLSTRVLHRPQTGHDVLLTLDGRLQAFAAEQLAGREGAVVVVDVEDGAVRALVSLPTFDPARLDGGEVGAEGNQPLLNRALQGLYPPGSTWKTVTLAAALDAGVAELGDVASDGDAVEFFDGFPVRCDNNPDDVTEFDLAHAYAWSCNVTFARLGAELGEERYRAYGSAFGVGDTPPFPLPVAQGSLTSSRSMSLPELASAAFGQGELLVTPLHMALVTAAVAGDGTLPVPHLLQDVPGVEWSQITGQRGTWRRAVPSEVARRVRDTMVLSAEEGWARAARRGVDVTMGGKTGTAQLATGAPHAWFIGFAPAERPRVAVAVLVVHGGEGSVAAAPLAGRVLERALALEQETDR